jgi:cyclopropane-fatty-acyl-phospholipid synthase
MFWPLELVLRRIIVRGSLAVIDAGGRQHIFGDGSGGPVVVRLTDAATERAITVNPQLALGEAYMDGRLRVESGGVYEFLELLMANIGIARQPSGLPFLHGLRLLTRRLHQFNPVGRARRNASHHYDIDGAIYDLFLDSDRQYSCAYFHTGADLEEAQHAKKVHIASKLALSPGQRVLDIGSGWGGLALWLAANTGCEVKGVTLSSEQLSVARDRARRQGLQSAVRFELEDYRRVTGTFDRIVSVGMFEHVGLNHYGTYFRRIRDLLTEDGVALLHSIGRSDGPGFTNPFIAKYIFPGGYIPALSEVIPAIERSGLIVSDIEILRLHYAETLKAWRERFMARRAEAVRLRGEAFCRMWEFYLAGSEAAFRYQGLMVFQIQLIKRVDALPIVRDYMLIAERRLEREAARRPEPRRLAGE